MNPASPAARDGSPGTTDSPDSLGIPGTHRRSRRPYVVALAVAAAAGLAVTALGPGGHGGNSANAAPVSGAAGKPAAGAPTNDPDLDGDGHPDEVFTSVTGEQSGDGTPYLGIAYGTAKGPDGKAKAAFSAEDLGIPRDLYNGGDERPATADLDEDGHPDVVVSPSAAVVWGGAKGPRKDSPIGKLKLPGGNENNEYSSAPVSGDFDADGHLDIATHRQDNDTQKDELVVLHGPFQRDGSPARTSEVANPFPNDMGSDDIGGLTTGDANGDKATDLVVHQVSDDEDAGSVLVTGGAKTDSGLSDKAKELPEGNRVVFGDFDGDKKRDTAVGNSGIPNDEDEDPEKVQGRVHVYYGKDPETAHTVKGGKKGGGFGVRLAVGDADGDGKDDLAVQDSDYFGTGAKIETLHGGSDGLGSTAWRSTSRSTKAGGDARDQYDGELYGAADYDGDGKDELAVGDSLYLDPKIAWWYTEGTDTDDATFTTEDFMK